MKTNRKNLLLLAAISLACFAPAAHAAFVISQPFTDAAFGNAATGQSFTPSVGMVVDPGPSTTTIDLTGFSLWTGGGSAAGSPATRTVDTTYLLIYNANPSGVASLVGSSTNFIDLNPAVVAGTELAWSFSSLTLNYNTTYFAVVSSSSTGTDTNDIGIQLQINQNGNASSYAGGSGLVNNFGVDARDTKFSATFANPVPEPSTALFGGLGLLALLRRRR